MSSPADFHARISAQLTRMAKDLKESVQVFGVRCEDSLARYDRDSRSWKTHQGLLLGGWEEYSETWPIWGTMLDGVSYRLPTPSGLVEHRASITSESVSGFLRLPTTHGFSKDGKSNGPSGNELGRAVNRLPTMTVCGNYNKKGASEKSGDGLATVVARMPTVTAQDSKNNGAPSQMERNTRPLNAEVGGSLNPEWVEWYMAWPIGWTDLKPLAMDRFQAWLRSHGGFSDD